MTKIIESDCGNVTTLAGDDVDDIITVSDTAKTRISSVLEDTDEGSFLRIGVQGGGCSGFQYVFGIHNEIEEDDYVNVWDGGKVVVDSMSMEYMKGSTLQYIKELGGEFFSVENPLATSSCGCGSSFS